MDVHKEKLGLLDHQSNLTWSGDGTGTFNTMLKHS
jgi:hypothetical protein